MTSGFVCRYAALLSLSVLPYLGGCALTHRPLARDAGSFAAATISATQGSASAYLEANRLHATEQTALAVLNYDSQPAWNPATYAKPLLSPAQLAQRSAILQALQQYATLIADLGSSSKNTDLDAASASVASSLGALSQTVSTRFAAALPAAPALSDTQVSTLGEALGRLAELLRERHMNRSLPKILASADPQLHAI